MPKQHILIVDDEPNLLESFKIGLELKDYVVSLASSGKKALVAIRQSTVEAVRAGAYDYLEKPSAPEAVHLRIQKAVEHQTVKQKLEDIETLVGDNFKSAVGKSSAISEVFDPVRRVAPTDSTILITGALAQKTGYFEAADSGMLFLDEGGG